MESFLFAGVSMLILLPILYFLPLGFTLKGKVFVSVASLLIGLFGLVSVAVMPLWQTGLILLVFVSALVYLVSKRNLDWLYVSEEDVDPFELEKAEEKALPVKEMNETYSYIASSEKIPKGIGSEETITNARKQDSAPIEIGLLEKLVAQNQKNLTMIGRSDDFYDREDIQELVIVDQKPDPLEPEIEEQIIVVNEQEVRNPELLLDSQPLDHNTTVNALPEMNRFIQISDDLADSDIEAIVQIPEHRTEEIDSLAIQVEDSHGYLSELEKMLDADEQGFNHDILMDKGQVENINSSDLESIPSFQLKINDELEEEDSLAWLDDENELEELELIEVPVRKSVNLPVTDHTFMDDDEFELEELLFAGQNTLPNKDKQKEKEQKMADNDQHMIKQ